VDVDLKGKRAEGTGYSGKIRCETWPESRAGARSEGKRMPLRFKRKESVPKAVKRLARRRTEKALEALQHLEELEAVHRVRKELKQLRALLRLTRAVMARSVYRRCSRELREAARHLAPARDAHVKVRALAQLATHFKHQHAPHPFPQIKELLAADCRREQTALSQHHVARQVACSLKEFREHLKSVRLEHSGWRAIEPGLKRAYSAGRRGYCVARKAGAPEDFHEWRKRVKDLFYQIGLLQPIWPEQMAAAEAELDRLGLYLGDAHDLVLLTQPSTLKRLQKCSEQETETLRAQIEVRQKGLHHSALLLGARFYREKPPVFCRRLGQYWKRWRRKRKRIAQV
jgi:CHAD domain-containing protein